MYGSVALIEGNGRSMCYSGSVRVVAVYYYPGFGESHEVVMLKTGLGEVFKASCSIKSLMLAAVLAVKHRDKGIVMMHWCGVLFLFVSGSKCISWRAWSLYCDQCSR